MEVGAPVAVFVNSPSSATALTNSMKFVEYDQRAHRLETLANFAFWVQSKVPVVVALILKTDLSRHREGPPKPQDYNAETRAGPTSKTTRALGAINRLSCQRLGR